VPGRSRWPFSVLISESVGSTLGRAGRDDAGRRCSGSASRSTAFSSAAAARPSRLGLARVFSTDDQPDGTWGEMFQLDRGDSRRRATRSTSGRIIAGRRHESETNTARQVRPAGQVLARKPRAPCLGSVELSIPAGLQIRSRRVAGARLGRGSSSRRRREGSLGHASRGWPRGIGRIGAEALDTPAFARSIPQSSRHRVTPLDLPARAGRAVTQRRRKPPPGFRPRRRSRRRSRRIGDSSAVAGAVLGQSALKRLQHSGGAV